MIAAGLVLWSHQHALLGMPEPSVALLRTSFGGLGVMIFFAISGYLNTLSVVHHRSIGTFLINRFLRIYPALATCVLFTVILGLCVSDLHAYLGMKLISYVVKNVTLFTGVMGGAPSVFETNAYPEALNGSLWTLPYEVKMYVMLVGLLAVCKYRMEPLIILFVTVAIIFALVELGVLPPFRDLLSGKLQFWLLFSIMFLTGSAIAAVQLAAGLPIALGFVVFTAVLSALTGSQSFAIELLLVVVVVALGSLPAPNWLQPPLDISYGTYLYAWPVQQVSALYFNSFWSALVFSLSLTFVLATLSAIFIERPALRLKIKPMHKT